jgi:hypothetical protein
MHANSFHIDSARSQHKLASTHYSNSSSSLSEQNNISEITKSEQKPVKAAKKQKTTKNQNQQQVGGSVHSSSFGSSSFNNSNNANGSFSTVNQNQPPFQSNNFGYYHQNIFNFAAAHQYAHADSNNSGSTLYHSSNNNGIQSCTSSTSQNGHGLKRKKPSADSPSNLKSIL